jgi:hypothetical protein
VTELNRREPAPSSCIAALRAAPFAILAAGLIGLLALLLAANATSWTGFNPDESRWLSRAHYFADLADPFGPTWADQYMTRGQPPLGSYAMGIGLLAQGRDLQTNPPWDFSRTWEENIAIGNKPVAADLLAGRRTSAVLIALTAVSLIALTYLFVPMPWALLAGALFAVHPFSVYIGSIAMSDALFGLLIALAALAAAAFARRPGWARAALLGALLGLGGATKLSPLAVAAGLCAAAFGFLVLAMVRHRRIPAAECAYAGYGIGIVFTAFATFVAIYPYLWPDPIARTRYLFDFRTEEMAAQASEWPVMAVPSRLEALRRVGVNFGERFSLSDQAASWLGFDAAPFPLPQLEVGIALLGVLLMAAIVIRAGPNAPQSLAFAVLGGQVVVTILGMRSEFDRYHLPMALLGAIACAVALEWLTRPLARAIAARAQVSTRDATRRSLLPY